MDHINLFSPSLVPSKEPSRVETTSLPNYIWSLNNIGKGMTTTRTREMRTWLVGVHYLCIRVYHQRSVIGKREREYIYTGIKRSCYSFFSLCWENFFVFFSSSSSFLSLVSFFLLVLVVPTWATKRAWLLLELENDKRRREPIAFSP